MAIQTRYFIVERGGPADLKPGTRFSFAERFVGGAVHSTVRFVRDRREQDDGRVWLHVEDEVYTSDTNERRPLGYRE